MKKALITGITGQDGAYLTELLLSKGYEVHGLRRRTSLFNTTRIDDLLKDSHDKSRKLYLHYGDLSDGFNILNIIKKIEPDEIYNLGAMSHVHISFQIPEYSADINGIGALRILESIKALGFENKTKFYQASTSELYGKVNSIPQNEETPFYPRSPYGVSKLYSYWITVNYRESYNIFACNGILFNHESPIRGETFVTRKITRAVAEISKGIKKCIYLGNLSSQRDWGHAKDFVLGMYLMLQQDKPDDYVLSTGIATTIRDFVKMCFMEIGVEVEFVGSDENEIGKVISNKREKNIEIGQTVVKVDTKYYRPTEVDLLIGDYAKAKEKLGWEPKCNLKMLIKEMIENDLKLLS